jgi:hypothetical protein
MSIWWGAFAFGFVIGWITYRTLRRKEGTAMADLSAVLGAVGGGVVTALFKTDETFAAYSIGLAAGFFLYLIVAFIIGGKEEVGGWMRMGS